ncbi:MAG: hypothetical protein U0792_00665 [Gemmataceae bacterium]
MNPIDPQTIIDRAQGEIAVARIIQAAKPATNCTIHRPFDDPTGITPQREVTFRFPSEVAALEFFEAMQKAAGKL